MIILHLQIFHSLKIVKTISCMKHIIIAGRMVYIFQTKKNQKYISLDSKADKRQKKIYPG